MSITLFFFGSKKIVILGYSKNTVSAMHLDTIVSHTFLLLQKEIWCKLEVFKYFNPFKCIKYNNINHLSCLLGIISQCNMHGKFKDEPIKYMKYFDDKVENYFNSNKKLFIRAYVKLCGLNRETYLNLAQTRGGPRGGIGGINPPPKKCYKN